MKLGLNADLKAALTATGKMRNKFAHRLDMKLGEKEAKDLIAALRPEAKRKWQALFESALSEAPQQASLPTEGRIYFTTQMQVVTFFMQLFDMVAEER